MKYTHDCGEVVGFGHFCSQMSINHNDRVVDTWRVPMLILSASLVCVIYLDVNEFVFIYNVYPRITRYIVIMCSMCRYLKTKSIYKTPLVLGTSFVPVLSTAAFSATAKALKALSALSKRYPAQGYEVSQIGFCRRRQQLRKEKKKVVSISGTYLWWSLNPLSTSTWRVIPAAWANDWSTWGIISQESAPIFSLFKSKLISAKGRPEISTTALDNAYTDTHSELVTQFMPIE